LEGMDLPFQGILREKKRKKLNGMGNQANPKPFHLSNLFQKVAY